MPLTLATRIGQDTLGKLEQAARRRHAEARRLEADEPLGAIYLYGYTIEMRLKAAYYRIIGLAPASVITRPIRNAAEARIRNLVIGSGAVGHHLYGWAKALEDARAMVRRPLPFVLAQSMYTRVQSVALCWTEVLRYRANKPYNQELLAVRSGADWFKANGRRLWS